MNFMNRFSNIDLCLNTWNESLLHMALSVWFFMSSLATVIWTRSMETCKTLRLFSFLHFFIYMGCNFSSSWCVPHLTKYIFVCSFETCYHGALSPQLPSNSSLFFFNEFCCFGHPFKNILEFMSSFYWKQFLFLFPIFSFRWFSGRGENWNHGHIRSPNT